MVSKQLESIISGMPSATVPAREESQKASQDVDYNDGNYDKRRKIVKIVAAVPEYIKDELQVRSKRTGETEKTIILKALKAFGFNIDESMLVDRRTLRK
jgi:hypothetical protein